MKIKKFLGLSAIAALAVGLASCGQSADNSHTIDFYTTAGDDYMVPLNAAKAKYESENAGWTVNITNGFSYDSLKTKVTQCLSANTQPSVAYCYPDHVANYLKTGKVVNMQTFIDDEKLGFTAEEWNDFVPSYMEEGTAYEKEGMYSLPMSRSTEVIYYNKTVFDANNISVPTTWDQLWNVCVQLKALYPKSSPLGYDSEANWVITYLEQYAEEHGGKYYTDGSLSGNNKIIFNNDVTKGFFETLKAKYDDGLFTTQTISGAYTSKLFVKYDKRSESADYKKEYTGSFISIGSTGGAKNQAPKDGDAQFAVGIAAVPGITAEKAVCISQGPSLVMFDQGSPEKIEMTWKFVKLLLSSEVQASYCSGGYSPVRKSAFQNPALIEVMEDGSLAGRVTAFTQTLAEKDIFYTSDAFNGSAVARTQIGAALVTAMKSQGTSKIAETISEAADEAKYYTK